MIALVEYNEGRNMRKSHKAQDRRAQQEQDFERLYRTIPNGGGYTGRRKPDEQLPPVEPGKPRWKKVLKRIIITLAIILAVAGLWLGWKFASNIIKVFGWNGLWDLFHSQKLKGEDVGRVNILLAGNSADDPGHGGAQLTDSIMLVSINTKDNTGYIMSIPRDLYVDIPDNGYAKINEAYVDGESDKFSESGYPDGGMGMLEKVVSQRFGVTINYYALVNYTALKQAVDAVGGVTINITSTDPRGLYDPSPDLQTRQPLVKLPNGPVTLDGKAALNLARARGDSRKAYGYGNSDFTRTENQRKILIGLKDKATSASTLSNPVKIGQLLDSFGSNVKTDFKTGELRRLQKVTKQVPNSKIASVSLNNANGKNLLTSYTTRSRQSALVPAAGVDDYSDIQAFLNSLQ
jgi:polyisoprenyl-teichoic acid--peptidoglycan teichoic acid transferase